MARKTAPRKAKKKVNKVRPLQLFIVFAVLMLSVRVVSIYEKGNNLIDKIRLEEKVAYAGDKAVEEPVEEEQAEDKSAAGEKEVAAAEEALDEEASYGDFSSAELDVLQSLSDRRQQLEARERELDRRLALLSAAEDRLNSKTRSLREIQDNINTARSEIEVLVKAYDIQENKKFKSLIKTYETMKAKQAAAIFNQLDLDVLIDIARNMKESKMAPVLAAMSPAKAKTLTMELAKSSGLPDLVKNSLSPKN